VCRSVYAEIVARPSAASQARAWTARTLADCYGDSGDLLEDAELVVSELITNAVRAGSETIRIHIDAHTTRAVIGVRDDAPGQPQVRQSRVDEAGGRGLAIVAGLARGWGIEPHQIGKTVWASLAVPAVATSGFDCRDVG
jgi:signal transduction histidine kinase